MPRYFVRVVREWSGTVEADDRDAARIEMLDTIAHRHADTERVTVQSDAQIKATQINLYRARKARQ